MKEVNLKEKTVKEYNNYIKNVTPSTQLLPRIAKAFLIGGLICVLGQWIIDASLLAGFTKEEAGTICSILLILISVLLTGFGLFSKIAEFAGAGILVPITGFANGVASSAIEYKKEGQVFGIGCKIFTIAGPVILYGITFSWLLGLLFIISHYFGIL